ncbi:GNAT family N-acetyltransferase [Nocardia carnea]|uniref:GNAT family N-acetyltransferase n=1 Tax=Nocardia carnea TaxID=37328 RepID=UPI0024580340|nr:GNAT family N-acetyltransferase [Nocardia carnea]
MQIEQATADHPWWIAPAGELLETACGSGYITNSELLSLAATDDSEIIIAHGPAGLLGVAIVAIADEVVRTQLNRTMSALGLAENTTADETVGWLRAVVVDPSVRGQRIGSRTVEAGLDFLRQKRCGTVYAASWISGTDQQSEGMLTRTGFAALGVIPNYWSEVVDYHGACAVCGTACRCSATIMRTNIEPATGTAVAPGRENSSSGSPSHVS